MYARIKTAACLAVVMLFAASAVFAQMGAPASEKKSSRSVTVFRSHF